MFFSAFLLSTTARQLYERLGYEIIGERKDYVIAGHSEFLPRKSLAILAEFKPEALVRRD